MTDTQTPVKYAMKITFLTDRDFTEAEISRFLESVKRDIEDTTRDHVSASDVRISLECLTNVPRDERMIGDHDQYATENWGRES
jgi:hypothetical protein